MHGFIAVIAKFASPRTPIVRTVHNCFKFAGAERLKRVLQNSLEKLSRTTIISVSADVQKNEVENWGTETTLIENWINVNDIIKFSEVKKITEQEHPVVAFLGNCSPTKDHEMVLETLLNYPDIHIIHIGHAHNSSIREIDILKKLDAENRLIWNNSSQNPFSLLLQSDALIVSSKNEGMSLALMEGLTLGIQCWIRDNPGVRWASGISNSVFFTSTDDLIELFEQLLFCNKFKDNRKHVNLKQDLIKRFSPKRGVEQYIKIYQKLLSEIFE
jgi:glycosyltransferase involved in cell wall biosynthesis